MKKILAFTLALILVLSSIPVLTVSAVDGVPSSTGFNSIPITEANGTDVTVNEVVYKVVRDYKGLIEQIKDGKIENSLIFADDIDLGGEELTAAIATLDNGVTVNGNGYSIINFSVKVTSNASFGLFGNPTAGETVRICNLTVGSIDKAILFSINPTTTWKYFAVLFGDCGANFDIENVTIYANLEKVASQKGGFAGFIGQTTAKNNQIGKFTDCAFYGKVENATGGQFYAAGFIGVTSVEEGEFTFTGCTNGGAISGGNRCAGFISQANGATVSFQNCANEGDVKGNGYLGGYIGDSANVKELSFNNCTNKGNVAGSNNIGGYIGELAIVTTLSFDNCANEGSVTGEFNVGGFIGNSQGSNSLITINSITFGNCDNTGAISGTKHIGGFVGGVGGKVLLKSLCMTNCVNSGKIEQKENEVGCSGGLAGMLQILDDVDADKINYQFLNCENRGGVSGIARTGGLVGALSLGEKVKDGAVDFLHCRNYGAVSATETNDQWHGFGGIVGCQYVRHNVNLIYCANFGEIKGEGVNAGGAIGFFYSPENANTGHTPVMTIKGFVNMSAVSSSDVAGGIFGAYSETSNYRAAGAVKLSACVNLGAVNGGSGKSGEIFAATMDVPTEDTTIEDPVATITSLISFEKCIVLKDGNEDEKAKGLTVYTNLEDAVKEINKLGLGCFEIQNEKVTFNPQKPQLVGVQTSKVVDNKRNVRFVAVLKNKDLSQYQSLGFQVAIVTADGTSIPVQSLNCKHVFSSLLARGMDGEMKDHRAAEIGGDYIFALSVDNIPANEKVTFTVTPYAVLKDGTTETLGTSWTVTLDGSADPAFAPAA